jgi:hypothetical protein
MLGTVGLEPMPLLLVPLLPVLLLDAPTPADGDGDTEATPLLLGDGIPENGDGDIDASGPLLGLLEDPGKKNSIEVGDGDGDSDGSPWL